jgi:HD superfamily phosphohydrolase
MSSVAFADVVHQTIYFSKEIPAEKLVLELVDTAWFQRLRDIAQTGNTNLVYMFSEHSRFGHSLGVAYLACHLMSRLALTSPEQIELYRPAVAAAALLHDIGHIAPGSHTAYKTWYPQKPDCHEDISIKIIREDPEIQAILKKYGPNVVDTVCKILEESPEVPAWTWEIISGGGWNVDRGNWCIVDSVMAGVTYGRYNIPALLESMVLTDDGHLALQENRLDAMVHFAIARHSMYRQIYHHRVLLSSETLNRAVVDRVRDLGTEANIGDPFVRQVIASDTSMDLPLSTIFAMREPWWRYHIFMWSMHPDKILRDLAGRLLNRRLLKTVKIAKGENFDGIWEEAKQAVIKAGFDPKYYLHKIGTEDVHAGDARSPMKVLMDDGRKESLAKVEPLWDHLTREAGQSGRRWIALPAEAKVIMGRNR